MPWRDATREDLLEMPLPLEDIVSGSLYYPACGFDGNPVRTMSRRINRFVYVDYGPTAEDLHAELHAPKHGFHGYSVLVERRVTKQELTPHGWQLPPLEPQDGDPRRAEDFWTPGAREPFACWVVLERDEHHSEDHGPPRFSLLHIRGDGAATYSALYNSNGFGASCIAIIQPGTGYGGNWTDFRDRRQILGRVVMERAKAEPPRLFLQGGGGSEGGGQPFWPEFSEFLQRFDPEASVRWLELWQRPV